MVISTRDTRNHSSWSAYSVKSSKDDSVYNVTVMPQKPKVGEPLSRYSVRCDCPDARFHYGKVQCKHCIYVMVKKVYV